MTRHSNSHVNVDLQRMANPTVDAERICRISIHVFGPLIPYEYAYDDIEQDCRQPSAVRTLFIGRIDLWEGVKGAQSCRECVTDGLEVSIVTYEASPSPKENPSLRACRASQSITQSWYR